MRKFISGLLMLAILAVAMPVSAATTYTSSLCIPKPTPNDVASQNTWGTLLNTGANITDGITSAVTTISVAGSANVVLTFNCGSVDQTDAAHFIFTGVLTGNIYVLWPNSRARMFSVTNSTTGSYTLSLGANSGGSPAGTTIAVGQGTTGMYYSDGTNVLTRVSPGGITASANSVLGNTTGSSAAATSLAVPACSGGLTYAQGSGFGCNSGGGGGGGGSGLAFGGTPSSNFVASPNTMYCIDTSGGTVQMTLPGSPVAGNVIVFTDCAGTFATNNMTVANNANLLMGLNQNMTVSTTNAAATLLFSGVTLGWRMF